MKEIEEMNELETHLRTWAPRRPSARLKLRLFAQPAPAATVAARAACNLQPPTCELQPATLPFRLSWLAPATAALFLMCVLFNQHNTATLAGAAGSGPLVAMIMSNQSAAAYLPGSFKGEQNILGNTFEWTNVRGSTSSIPSLSGSRGKH